MKTSANRELIFINLIFLVKVCVEKRSNINNSQSQTNQNEHSIEK